MYPVIAATDEPIGLGFTPGQIAQSLLFLGPVVLIVQLLCFPSLAKRMTYVGLWRMSSGMFCAAYVLFPLLVTGVPRTPVAVQAVELAIVLGIRVAAVVIGYTSIAILVGFYECQARDLLTYHCLAH